jgi:hypothetical protein
MADRETVLRFRLTTADALAYERLPSELGWRGKVILFAGPALVGMLAGIFDDLPPIVWWPGILLLLLLWYTGCAVGNHLLAHRRARLMAAREGSTEVEDRGDRLIVTSGSGTREIPIDRIGQVLIEDGHIFVLCREYPLIIPLRAFVDRERMRAFGVDLDRRSEQAVP